MSSNTSSDNTKMSSSTKQSTKTSNVALKNVKPLPAAAVAAAEPSHVAVADTPAKATPAPRVKKEKVTPAPAPAPVPVVEVVAPPVVELESKEKDKDDVGANLLNSVADLHDQLTALKTAFSAAAAAVKVVEKQAASLVKKSDRRRKRKVTEAVPGAPAKSCIFTKDVKVSAELCAFLGKPKDTNMSRSAVTKSIVAYAKSSNLMDKQTIHHDASLRKLLSLGENDSLTIMNLQKYLKSHYVKSPAVVPVLV